MWIGLAAFLISIGLSRMVSAQKRILQQRNLPLDAGVRKLDLAGRILFCMGILLWIYGALQLAATGGK